MAFVYKSKRDCNRVSVETGDIGPGEYNTNTSAIRVDRPSYAPFSTTTKRHDFTKSANPTPGPGSYNSRVNAVVDREAGGTAFRSKTKRFKDQRTDYRPGPGSYSIPGFQAKAVRLNVPKPRSQYKSLLSEIFKENAPNAPSIPAAHQSLGYDEYGNSIRPEDDGVPETSENPVHAFTKTSNCKNVPAYSFGKSSSHRSRARKTANAPGPGSYSAMESVNPSKSKQNYASVFRSNVKRGIPGKRQDDTPGPGAYRVPANDYSRGSTDDSLQFFGSTSNRFGDNHKFETPGPGEYGVTGEFELLKQRYHAKMKLARGQPAPFLVSSNRFDNQSATKTEVPGAGMYSIPTMVDDLNKKLAGRNGVFGSTNRRFAEHKNDGTPGPGSYNSNAETKSYDLSVSQNGLSAFASTSKRNRHLIRNQDVPGPGAYRPDANWAQHVEESRLLKANASKRCRKPNLEHNSSLIKKDTVPGPGAYDNNITAIKVKKGSTKSHFGQASRFGKARHQSTPGPGQYEVWGDLNKRTFNIEFMEE